MLHSLIDYLLHINDEIDFILSVTKNKTKEAIESDKLIKRAIVRSLEIIGEATKHVDFAYRNKYPQVDWKGMAGTRDKLIHDYMDIDYDIVFDIIVNELPQLEIEIKRIIQIESQ